MMITLTTHSYSHCDNNIITIMGQVIDVDHIYPPDYYYVYKHCSYLASDPSPVYMYAPW